MVVNCVLFTDFVAPFHVQQFAVFSAFRYSISCPTNVLFIRIIHSFLTIYEVYYNKFLCFVVKCPNQRLNTRIKRFPFRFTE